MISGQRVYIYYGSAGISTLERAVDIKKMFLFEIIPIRHFEQPIQKKRETIYTAFALQYHSKWVD